MTTKGKLAAMIRAAASGALPRGWLYLAAGELTPDTQCVLLADIDTDDLEAAGAALGCPREGIETEDIKSIHDWSESLVGGTPSDADLVRSVDYHLRFDAFIPSIDAPDPPPIEVVVARMDRDFYDSLGKERSGTHCAEPACERGAVALSVFCRRHHFESVKGRPCPFDD
jgi:hypothetical protein